MKRLVPGKLRAVARAVRDRVLDPYALKSYSQEGEDLVLARIFEHQPVGFYVDVGAHHPRRFSNTFLFYKRGWRGLNIEPNPDALRLFERDRPRDTTLCVGVSDATGELMYYRFNEPALNSFDGVLSRSRVCTDFKIVGTLSVPVQRLDTILAAHVGAATVIDFLSVDVEGHDLNVLRSNDWSRFRPRYVVVEALDSRLSTIGTSPLHLFLTGQRYTLFGKTVHSLIYREGTEE